MLKAFYIPNGPKNLAFFFPAINFNNVDKYYIEVMSDADIIATTTINELDGECCSDKVRVHFLNYLGAIDAVNFKLVVKEHEAKSESFQRRTTSPLVKKSHGINRYNVKATDVLTISTIEYEERDLTWITELLDSPLIWVEWTGIQGQSDDYIPYTVVDMKTATIKAEDRFVYEITLQIVPSHDRFIIRH